MISDCHAVHRTHTQTTNYQCLHRSSSQLELTLVHGTTVSPHALLVLALECAWMSYSKSTFLIHRNSTNAIFSQLAASSPSRKLNRQYWPYELHCFSLSKVIAINFLFLVFHITIVSYSFTLQIFNSFSLKSFVLKCRSYPVIAPT